MNIPVYVYLSLSLSIYLSLYIYIYICIYIHTYTHMYILYYDGYYITCDNTTIITITNLHYLSLFVLQYSLPSPLRRSMALRLHPVHHSPDPVLRPISLLTLSIISYHIISCSIQFYPDLFIL